MISILGDYSYTFPQPIPLKLKLKDMLEDNVDEKYYLSDDLMNHIQKTAEEHEEYTQYDRYNGDLEMWCRVWKDKSLTLNTKCKDTKIYVKNATKKGYLEAEDGDGVDISSRMEYHRGTVQKGKIQTLTTMGGENNGVVVNNFRIRKLTPRECGRLMNVKNEDITNMLKNQSDASAYHCFGDSICTNVLMAIFGELLNIDWKRKLKEMLNGNTN